jgi:hypothetical protein
MADDPVLKNDVEAGNAMRRSVTEKTYTDVYHGSVLDEVARAREIQNSFAPLRYMRRWEEWLDEKMGIETQGIDRIPEEDKRPPSIINSFFMWWSMICNVGKLPIGLVGPAFGLSLNQSVAAIVVGTFLGALCTGYTGTLGPKVSMKSAVIKSALTFSPARPTRHRYFSILVWILGREALLRTERGYLCRLRCGQCGRLRSTVERCVGLHHDHQRRLCHCCRPLIRLLRLRLCFHPHLREILVDLGLYPHLCPDRPGRPSRQF